MGGDAKTADPVPDEGVPAGNGVYADQQYCLQHSAGTVDNGEEVPEPLLGNWERSYNVHVDALEPLVGYRDGLQSSGGLSSHLGAGALLAVCHPGRDFFVHAGPHHPVLHESLRGPGARLRLAVEGVEDLAAVAQRDDRPRVASRDVAEYAERDQLQGEVGFLAAEMEGQSRWAAARAV